MSMINSWSVSTNVLDEKEKIINLEKSELTEMGADEMASLVKKSIRKHHDVNLSEMGLWKYVKVSYPSTTPPTRHPICNISILSFYKTPQPRSFS